MSIDKYDKLSTQIHKLSSLPPEKQIEHFASVNKDLSKVAPSLAVHLNSIGMNGLQYLHNKLPKPNVEFAGEDAYEPSKSQKTQWLDHYAAVNDPISALDHIKNGTLTSQHMEALNMVHPALLDDMKQKVMEQMTPKNMKGLPYSTKIALSKFMGAPAHGSLLPQVIANDQMNYAQPQVAASGTPKRVEKSSLGGLSKLNVAKRSATETQEMEESDV